MFETSALESLYGGQVTLSTQEVLRVLVFSIFSQLSTMPAQKIAPPYYPVYILTTLFFVKSLVFFFITRPFVTSHLT